MYEKQNEYFAKVDKLQQKYETEKKAEVNKYKDQLA